MRRPELDDLIRNGNHPQSVMLYGESHFLIDYYLRVFGNVPDANLLSLYHDEYDFNSAKVHLSQGSLFGGQNILIIKNEKKVAKKELDTLLELVKKSPDNTLIYAYYGSDMKTSAKSFTKAAGGVEVRLFSPFANEAKSLVLQEAHRLGIELDSYAAAHLIESQNGDLSLAFNELNKLRILGRPISTKDIDALVYGVAEVKIEQFINHLLAKKDFKLDLQRILESGEDEIRIVTAISSYMTQLYLFYAHIKIHGIADSAAILGYKLPRNIEQERAQQSIRFKQEQYNAILNLLLDNELKMKSSGAMDKNALLLSTLIKLQSFI
ncbi:MAG: DNA polymerase III subunit delta [Thiovulaceae bacterium]|nr:DNA polymerase III subunit delta [Sulfurimonadaceae bacterium]